MNSDEIPEDQVASLEATIRAAGPVGPGPRLRERVVASVASELRRCQRQDRWSFAAGLAAMVLIGLNLSLGARTWACGSPRIQEEPVTVSAESAKELAPELTVEEVRRELVLLKAGSRLLPWSQPRGGAGSLMDGE